MGMLMQRGPPRPRDSSADGTMMRSRPLSRSTPTREGVFAGGDAVMGARTVVEAVAIAKKVAESMDAYMKALPADNTPDPYADIPVFSTPTSDVLAKQDI